MSLRRRHPIPIALGTLVALFAFGAVAFAITRPTVGRAHRLEPIGPATSAIGMPVASAVTGARSSVMVRPKPVVPATPAPTPAPPVTPEDFDESRAMAHVRTLSVDIGVRAGGTPGEDRAIAYARDYVTSLGYQVTVLPVPLPNGRTSHDVIAQCRGATGPIVVLGGHIDTKAPAPGADDNATGVGTVLELARDFAKFPAKGDVRFVAFGCEELLGDGNSDHHHFGSRAYVASLTAEERKRFAAAIAIDMIGYGPDFRVRNMGVGTRVLCDRLLAAAQRTKAPLAYLRDPGRPSGWSDHEPFERAGFPAAWLEWRDDANAHTTRDSYEKVDARKVAVTGRLVHAWLVSLTDADLARLAATR
jgi:hypothetical protein